MKSDPVNRSSAPKNGILCELCHKPGQKIENGVLNPLNPNNKLQLPTEMVNSLPNGRKAKNGKNNSNGSGKKTYNPESERESMAKTGAVDMSLDRMMLDSRITAHITNRTDRVQKRKKFETPITLSDDSKSEVKLKGYSSGQMENRKR